MSKNLLELGTNRGSSLLERLYNNCVPVTESGCLIWLGYVSKYGYGTITTHHGEVKRVHRLSWELTHGEIPKGLFVCHKCDVKLCVRPEHLFLGTPKENTQDMVRKMRHSIGDKNWATVLKEEDIVAIRNDPRICKEIAKDYGVHLTTIASVKLRRTWKHVA